MAYIDVEKFNNEILDRIFDVFKKHKYLQCVKKQIIDFYHFKQIQEHISALMEKRLRNNENNIIYFRFDYCLCFGLFYFLFNIQCGSK